jgi:GNAT superfamily N-acetyltransferase
MTEVRRAGASDLATVTSTLANAFSTDPVTRWMLRDKPDAERRLGFMFGAMGRLALRRPAHEIYLTDDGSGVAFWRGIDDWKVPTGDVIRSTPAIMRAWGVGNVRGLRLLTIMERAHPTEPHYYLEFLGTRRDRQGTGVGSALMTAMVERCDREGVPAYLENSNPANNTAFYARYGFEEQGAIELPAGCPPMVPMWRDPR